MKILTGILNVIKIIFLYLFTGLIGLFIPKNKKIVIITASKGKFYNGNAQALFEYIMEEDNTLEVYFFLSKKDLYQNLSMKKTNIVYQYSVKGILLFLRARTVCITHGQADLLGFPISPWQNWIFLGHGIGTKALGFLKDKIPFLERVQIMLNKLYTYIITSDFDRYMFCAMNHMKPSKIVITGYPRTDTLLKAKKETSGKEKTILYVPTYRTDGITRLFPFDEFRIEDFLEFLDRKEINIDIRFHPNNYKGSRDAIKEILASSLKIKDKSLDVVEDVQDLLLDADILVTDFSSISRDFLLLDRPMIFIMNGIEDLGNLAFPIRKEYAFCGYKVRTYQQFIQAVEEILSGRDQFKQVRGFVRDLSYNDLDGESSKRVAKLIKSLARIKDEEG